MGNANNDCEKKTCRYRVNDNVSKNIVHLIRTGYFKHHTFRACFTSHGNLAYDSVCTLTPSIDVHGKILTVSINDGNRMRDKDCDSIVIMSDENEILFVIYYKPDEFIQEYGVISLSLDV
jgi:hypothetical protein